MKIQSTFLIILVFTITSCSLSSHLTDHDYSYNTNFKQFRYYNFVKCDNDTTEICDEIQATIQKQMEIRGYKFDPKKADIYIGYNLIPNRVLYKAFEQPSMASWINNKENDEVYKREKFNFGDGMIMISIIEAKNNSLIWRGFSTDISKKRKENYNMNYYYSNAVRNIFKEYTLFASK